MEIKNVDNKPNLSEKQESKFNQFVQVINELKKQEISSKLVDAINSSIDQLNTNNQSGKEYSKELGKFQCALLKEAKEESNLVVKNHYRNYWMAIGMAAFGIPMGTAFGVSLDNMAFIGIGLPIGMALGIAYGTKKDQEAKEEGRQLDLELK